MAYFAIFFIEIVVVDLRTKLKVCTFSHSVDKEAAPDVAYQCRFCAKPRRFCPTVTYFCIFGLYV